MAEMRNNLTKKQKLALTGLTIFGVFIVGLWVFNLQQQISKPLAYKSSESNNQNTAATASEEEKQKTQDTDGDGLTDYDELNVYKTSPYLPDSDSDGISDGAEVQGGTNPNCPEGKSCSTEIIQPADSIIGSTASTSGAQQTNTISTDATGLLAGQSDSSALRQMLAEAGLDKATLDQLSDEALLNIYKEMIASSTKQ